MKRIKPVFNNGGIQIKFNMNGSTYRCTPINGAKYDDAGDLETVQAIANQISLDIRNGAFDVNDLRLTKYVLISKIETNVKFDCLLDLYEYWYENLLDVKEWTKAGKYTDILRHIKREKPGLYDTEWLNVGMRGKIANSTYNNRLVVMKMCFEKCLEKGLIDSDPWKNICSKNVPDKYIKPFTENERNAIIEALEGDHYQSLTMFLFLTGCRFSEAIGLTWDKIEWEENYILINQSLSIDPTKDGFTRVMKERKNGGFVLFPMDESLKELLENQPRINQYVFLSPRNKIISIATFRRLSWEPALKRANVPFRSPHKIRHTFGSVGVQQGIPLTEVAALMGDRLNTVVQNYSHVIDKPRAPKMF